MNKIMLPALLAALSITVAAPSFADEAPIFGYSSHYVTQDIEAQGFNVTNVEEWGDRVVATVVDDQGHSSFKYFTPETLTLLR